MESTNIPNLSSNMPLPYIVLIGTPTLDGKLDAWYVNSLIDTIKLGIANNIFIKPIFLAYESILPMSRNELFKIAYDGKFDCLLQIDADVCWDPSALIEIILAKEEVIGLPYPLKTEGGGNYNTNIGDPKFLTTGNTGYIKVSTTGTGCLKITRPVIEALYNSNDTVFFRNKQIKNICEYLTIDSVLIGEDVTLCNKIKELGFNIWLKPDSTCMHIGNKIYAGDFQSYLNAVQQQTTQTTPTSGTAQLSNALFDI